MSKLDIRDKRGIITIINRLSYPETVNDRVLTSIVSGQIDSFLPVTITQKRKETLIECQIQKLQTINQYFSGIVSKKEFLDLVYQIVHIINTSEKNGLKANNIELQNDCVFVDPINKTLWLIYWPIVNNQRSKLPEQFLQELPYGVEFDQDEDNSYLGQYAAFFCNCSPFSTKEFEKFILKIQNKENSFYSQHLLKMHSSDALASAKAEITNTSLEASIEYDPFSNNGPIYPVLVRSKTGEVYRVNKPEYRIGSDESCNDLFIPDNKYISRIHAAILTKNNRYFIIDRGSKNGTFVNGVIIPRENEKEIFDGTVLHFINDEFLFYIKKKY